MITLDLAIFSTLLYFDIFSYPLTFDQLYHRLLGLSITPTQLHHRLHYLVSRHLIATRHSFFYLPFSPSLPYLRLQRQANSHLLLKKAQSYLSLFTSYPFLLGVYLTGSLAARNADSQADIDLLIITSDHSLWLTRLFLNLALDKRHLRRHPLSSLSASLFCPNIFLTPHIFSHLPVSHDLYTAYELLQIHPLFERYPLLSALLAQNSWLSSFFPNFPLPSPSSPSPPSYPHLAPLNFSAYLLQKLYMSPRLTREKVTYYSAFFHPRPLSPVIMQQLTKRAYHYHLLPCLNYIHSLPLIK